MELVQELFVTAIVALIFSFVVAKLVSIATGSDDGRESGLKSRGETIVEELKFDGGLRVQGAESERRVQLDEAAVEKKVVEFELERLVNKSEESRCIGEFEEKWCDLTERVEEGEVVEVSEKSSERLLPEEESVTETVTGTEVNRDEGTESVAVAVAVAVTVTETVTRTEVNRDEGTNLDGLVVEEVRESTEVDETDGGKEGNGIEERIADNTEADSEIVSGSATDDAVVAQVSEIRDVERGDNQGGEIEGELGKEEEKGEVVGEEEDDWEGIERSVLQEAFAAAANYVASGGKDGDWLTNLDTDVQMLLYGLHKVAMEGTCYEPQPMALKVSARAKWNAWQKLGSMNPEVAMEQYITLLSDKVPGWMEGKSPRDDIADSSELGIPAAPYAYPQNQLNSTKKTELELKSGTDGGDLTTAQTL